MATAPFSDRARDVGVGRGRIGVPEGNSVGWGTAFLDYDNDGDQDLYLAAGYLDTDQDTNPVQQPNALFRNEGDGTFSDLPPWASGANDPGFGRGAAYGDFDGDGCLDLYLVNIGELEGRPGVARLFRNNCASGQQLAHRAHRGHAQQPRRHRRYHHRLRGREHATQNRHRRQQPDVAKHAPSPLRPGHRNARRHPDRTLAQRPFKQREQCAREPGAGRDRAQRLSASLSAGAGSPLRHDTPRRPAPAPPWSGLPTRSHGGATPPTPVDSATSAPAAPPLVASPAGPSEITPRNGASRSLTGPIAVSVVAPLPITRRVSTWQACRVRGLALRRSRGNRQAMAQCT